jgi:hypothetical protein
MARASHEVSVRLSAKDDASGAFKSAQKSAKGFSDFLTRTFVVTAGDVTRAVSAAWQGMKESISLAAQERALKAQIESIGGDFDSFIGNLQKVSDNTISTKDIIESSSRALLLGIPAPQIADLLETARVSAAATGQSVAQAFDDITTGIGRASPMILDNLGFVISLTEVYEKQAKQLGINASEMTKAQQSQALLNEVIAQGGERAEKFGSALDGLPTSVGQAEASTTNLFDATKKLGAAFIEGLSAVGEFADLIQKVADLIDKAIEPARKLGQILRILFGPDQVTPLRGYKEDVKGLSESTDEASEKTSIWKKILDRMPETFKRNVEVLLDVADSADRSGAAIEKAGDALEQAGDQAVETASDIDKLYESWEKLTGQQDKAKTEMEVFADTLKELGVELEEDAEKTKRYGAAADFAWTLERAGIISREKLAEITRAASSATNELTGNTRASGNALDDQAGSARNAAQAVDGAVGSYRNAGTAADQYSGKLNGLTAALNANTVAAQLNANAQAFASSGYNVSGSSGDRIQLETSYTGVVGGVPTQMVASNGSRLNRAPRRIILPNGGTRLIR